MWPQNTSWTTIGVSRSAATGGSHTAILLLIALTLKPSFATSWLVGSTLPCPSWRKSSWTYRSHQGGRYKSWKKKTETARQITANKYFKFDAEDLPNFNTSRWSVSLIFYRLYCKVKAETRKCRPRGATNTPWPWLFTRLRRRQTRL